jgi:hypothetical protein
MLKICSSQCPRNARWMTRQCISSPARAPRLPGFWPENVIAIVTTLALVAFAT